MNLQFFNRQKGPIIGGFFMKKIGLWMAALTAVTVGGVYASWVYTGDAKVASKSVDKAINLEGYTSNAVAGEYGIAVNVDSTNVVNSTDAFYFDSLYAVSGATELSDPHQVVLVTNCSISITYTVNPLQTENRAPIDTVIQFSISNKDVTVDLDEGEMKIFSSWAPNMLEISGFVEGTQETGKWLKTGDGVYTYTISKQDLANLFNFDINNDMNLENATEHGEFNDAIFGLELRATVAEKE
jgi:hypothetical protein